MASTLVDRSDEPWALYTAENGHQYFYNHSTGESLWAESEEAKSLYKTNANAFGDQAVTGVLAIPQEGKVEFNLPKSSNQPIRSLAWNAVPRHAHDSSYTEGQVTLQHGGAAREHILAEDTGSEGHQAQFIPLPGAEVTHENDTWHPDRQRAEGVSSEGESSDESEGSEDEEEETSTEAEESSSGNDSEDDVTESEQESTGESEEQDTELAFATFGAEDDSDDEAFGFEVESKFRAMLNTKEGQALLAAEVGALEREEGRRARRRAARRRLQHLRRRGGGGGGAERGAGGGGEEGDRRSSDEEGSSSQDEVGDFLRVLDARTSLLGKEGAGVGLIKAVGRVLKSSASGILRFSFSVAMMGPNLVRNLIGSAETRKKRAIAKQQHIKNTSIFGSSSTRQQGTERLLDGVVITTPTETTKANGNNNYDDNDQFSKLA